MASKYNPPQPFHPETVAFLVLLESMNLKRYDELESLEAARARSRAVSGSIFAFNQQAVRNREPGQQTDGNFKGKREEIFIPSPEVKEGIPVYIYTPEAIEANPPIMIYCHGGGNIVGDRGNVEAACKIIAQGAKCIVVNVEYRLAPEFKFPAGLDDACQVARWVIENKEKIGGGPLSKVGVSGDSAGGQIQAGVAHDVPGLSFQVLIYPHVSARGDRSLPSWQEYKEGPILHHQLVTWFENLMGDVKDWRHPRFANILRDKFDHLPPCLLIVAECDPLRDDSYEYAKKLTAAGVHNELFLVKGAIHGFYTLPAAFPILGTPAHNKTIEFINKWGKN